MTLGSTHYGNITGFSFQCVCAIVSASLKKNFWEKNPNCCVRGYPADKGIERTLPRFSLSYHMPHVRFGKACIHSKFPVISILISLYIKIDWYSKEVIVSLSFIGYSSECNWKSFCLSHGQKARSVRKVFRVWVSGSFRCLRIDDFKSLQWCKCFTRCSTRFLLPDRCAATVNLLFLLVLLQCFADSNFRLFIDLRQPNAASTCFSYCTTRIAQIFLISVFFDL